MAEQPNFIKGLYAQNQSGFLINPDLKSYNLRWLHMIFGAITVGGFFVGFLGRDNDQAFRIGKKFFLWGMIVSSVSGLLYLLSLGEYLKPFMQNSPIYTLSLGVLLSLASIHFFFKQKFLISGSTLFVSLVSMVTTRHFLRDLRLANYFDPTFIKVDPQWSLIVSFVISFVLALALIGYMLKLYFREQS